MKLFTILFLAAFLVTSLFAQTWHTYNGHQYARTSVDSLTWTQAENEASSLGGHLVAINDIQEENWLKGTFGTVWFWVGLTDQATEGTWAWTTGEPVTYTNWNPGEPNNQGGAENWAGMVWPQNPGWNDFPDSYHMPGVMEVVPEPTTISIFGLGLLAVIRRRRSTALMPDKH